MTNTHTTTPAVAFSGIEVCRWYTVTGAEPLTDPAGREFTPEKVKVWPRAHLSLLVMVYGHRPDGGESAVAFNTAKHELPAWLRNLLPKPAAPSVRRLMEQILRLARDFPNLPHPDAELDDIERQLTELDQAARAVLVRPGQVWADLDVRSHGRHVRVVRIEGYHAVVELVDQRGRAALGHEAEQMAQPGRQTAIRLDRFQPGSTGYRLVQDAPGGGESR